MNSSGIQVKRCVLCGPKSLDENVAHFSFPKTKLFDRHWKAFCLCMKVDPTQVIFSTSKLCCIHFTQESFSAITGRHTLKKDAIPSLVPNYSENIPRTCSHNLTVPVVPKKREYGLHKYLAHCVLCKSKKTGVAFFRFPKNENTRKQWIEFCQVDSTRINKTSTLCQYHFTDADFRVSKCGRVSLNENSVPSIREVHPTNCRRNNKNKSPDVRAEERLVDHVNSIIPPKRPKLCSETRRNEGTNSKNKSPDVRAEEIVVDVNPIILPERPELCSETRFAFLLFKILKPISHLVYNFVCKNIALFNFTT